MPTSTIQLWCYCWPGRLHFTSQGAIATLPISHICRSSFDHTAIHLLELGSELLQRVLLTGPANAA